MKAHRKRSRGSQFTVRGVPAHVASGLRTKARRSGKSLNALLVEALSREFEEPKRVYHDLDWMIGTWVEDPEFDKIIAEQDQIDEEMWR